MDNTYSVYVKTDPEDNIIAINSSAFLEDLTGWVKIDEGEGDKYHHAQGNYLEKSCITKGVYRYKLVDGAAVEKTEEELAAEEAALPVPAPTSLERLEAQILYTATMTDTLVGE